jgi:molecular chaperone DnaJ
MRQPCPYCEGTGIHVKNRCTQCNGDGVKVTRSHKVSFSVPQGIQDGGTIRLEGEGHQQPGYPNGDILVYLVLTPHPRYKREGDHLHYTLKITLKEVQYLIIPPQLVVYHGVSCL